MTFALDSDSRPVHQTIRRASRHLATSFFVDDAFVAVKGVRVNSIDFINLP
jgi:hypothetical protein